MRLRRSNPNKPGITRRRQGRGFSYRYADGSRVQAPDELRRLKALAIPPAWTKVWICAYPNGHIQVVGLDDAGRRQYIYHEQWRHEKDREKFDRALDLGRSLVSVRAAITRQLREAEWSERRVHAAAARIIDTGGLRIGGAEYAEVHGSFGVTTLQCRHITVSGSTVSFDFPAKSGHHWQEDLEDEDLAATLAPMLQREPHEDALAYQRDDGSWHPIDSRGLNAYIGELAKGDFTAKDFRTWQATVLAAMALARSDPEAASVTARKKAVTEAMRDVADHLGNTMAVARSSYVDPRVVEAFMSGDTIPVGSYSAAEKAVQQLLRGGD